MLVCKHNIIRCRTIGVLFPWQETLIGIRLNTSFFFFFTLRASSLFYIVRTHYVCCHLLLNSYNNSYITYVPTVYVVTEIR